MNARSVITQIMNKILRFASKFGLAIPPVIFIGLLVLMSRDDKCNLNIDNISEVNLAVVTSIVAVLSPIFIDLYKQFRQFRSNVSALAAELNVNFKLLKSDTLEVTFSSVFLEKYKEIPILFRTDNYSKMLERLGYLYAQYNHYEYTWRNRSETEFILEKKIQVIAYTLAFLKLIDEYTYIRPIAKMMSCPNELWGAKSDLLSGLPVNLRDKIECKLDEKKDAGFVLDNKRVRGLILQEVLDELTAIASNPKISVETFKRVIDK